MILDRREYERLVEENKKLKEENEELRRVYDRLTYTNNLLYEFDYAVLLPKDSHTLRVWNDGRFEEKVVSVEVGQKVGSIPYLKIEK